MTRNYSLLLLIGALLITSCNSEPSEASKATTPQDASRAIPIQPYEALFEQYFETYPNEISKLPEGRAASDIREQAFRLYDEGRYDQAELLFFRMLDHTPDNNIYFYRANTLLADGFAEDARGEFSRLPPDAPYFAQARWYIALTYLKQNRLREAKILLSQISSLEEDTYKKTEAQALLTALESL